MSTNTATTANGQRAALPYRDGRVKVLQVIGGLNRAGAETWLKDVFVSIDPGRVEMHFVVHGTRGDYANEIERRGGVVLHCAGASSPIRYVSNLRRLIREHGPYEVVHSHIHHFSGFALLAAAMERVPKRFVHSHLGPRVEDDRFPRSLYTSVSLALIRRYATRGFAVSGEAARSLFGAKWHTEDRWRLLYCGIDLDRFHAEPDPAVVRAELDVPTGAFVIGHVGRFDPQKNHAFLLRIFAEIAARNAKAWLLSVGAGPLRAEVERAAEELGVRDRVVFAGKRDDVPRIMAAMDVFVFPSLYEGLPLVALEAQASGLPIILANSITPELVVARDLVRVVALESSTRAWADAISSVAVRSSASRVAALSALAGSRFDIRASAAALQAAYLL